MARRWTSCTTPDLPTMIEALQTSDAFAALPPHTAVVCHDAGAANIIIAGMKQSGSRAWRACMQGPAAKIWEAAFGASSQFETPEAALDGASFLLSGSGWASDLEHVARRQARRQGIACAAVVDHWVNYPQRFVRAGEKVLPDEIWVGDEEALQLAQQSFPGIFLRQVENWYLKQQLAALAKLDIDAAPELLYLAEPARDDWGRGTAGEFQALDYFARKLPQLKLPPQLSIRLRPHPSDALGKYDDWIAGHPELALELDTSADMAGALSRAGWVAGCESYGLVLALAAGRVVYCTLPPWAPACRLPHRGLNQLRALDEQDEILHKLPSA